MANHARADTPASMIPVTPVTRSVGARTAVASVSRMANPATPARPCSVSRGQPAAPIAAACACLRRRSALTSCASQCAVDPPSASLASSAAVPVVTSARRSAGPARTGTARRNQTPSLVPASRAAGPPAGATKSAVMRPAAFAEDATEPARPSPVFQTILIHGSAARMSASLDTTAATRVAASAPHWMAPARSRSAWIRKRPSATNLHRGVGAFQSPTCSAVILTAAGQALLRAAAWRICPR